MSNVLPHSACATPPSTLLASRVRLMEQFYRERNTIGEHPFSIMVIQLGSRQPGGLAPGEDNDTLAFIALRHLLAENANGELGSWQTERQEFAALMPGVSAGAALEWGDRLRHTFESHPLVTESDTQLTLFAGVACYGRDGTTWMELYRAAANRATGRRSKDFGRIISKGANYWCRGRGQRKSPSDSP